MGLSGALFGLLLLFPSIVAQTNSTEAFYLLAVTSQAVGGTTETLCVTVEPHQEVSLEVSLEHKENTVTLLTEVIKQKFHRCVPFQVPVVIVESVASIAIQIKGCMTQKNSTKFLITPPEQLTFIQTDKPLYKPGQMVKFRVVSLDSSFLTYNQKFPTIEVQDPSSNRIGQWLDVATQSGLVDLSYPLNSEATNGVYVITVWDEKKTQLKQTFQVKDYVLPTFEVTVHLPPVITVLDKEATLKVCAKYTYGKPVHGTVNATVCHNTIRYWWFHIYDSNKVASDICKDYILKTDKSGCAQCVINLQEYAITTAHYESVINVQSEVEEDGTGVIMKGSGSSFITADIYTLSFEDSPTTFKLGLMYEGKVKVTDPNSNPLKQTAVLLTVGYDNDKHSFWRLVTDDNGVAEFSLNTEAWGLAQVSLQAQLQTDNRPVVGGKNQFRPPHPRAELWLQPFYSESLSFIKLKQCSTPFSCNKNAVIEAEYLIPSSTLTPQQNTIIFFYMVMSKGHLVQHGHLLGPIHSEAKPNGTLSFSLENMIALSPVAQVVLYTILPSGEAVADSLNYPIQPCLANKVALNFSASPELPGSQVALMLEAAPESLCSVRAIDQSMLLLQPETVLDTEAVFNMLPVQTLSGYPYNVNDEDSYPCLENPQFMEKNQAEPSVIGYFPYNGRVDVYSSFRNVGIKILTNTIVKKLSICNSFLYLEGPVNMVAPAEFPRDTVLLGSGPPVEKVVTIRKYFLETWIWDLVLVSQTGLTAVNKTVPDSITTWQADAFCTSPVGFGVAPKAELTAFQPFFVSLTMPSSVIRGEVFTLKATVFNYLQSCMMVKVILEDSKQFSVQVTKDSNYTRCICSDESQTFSWTITPLVVGEVSISVTAEAVQSSTLCGANAVVVPQKGHTDIVIKTLLVQAEGTIQFKSYNDLLCPDGVVEKTVSLDLPAVYVNDSARASVSVLGDLMGRALQNLASLLAMPSGCGEQNMLLFAPNIFILQYLESTNQLSPEIMSIAEPFLVTGYQRELTYKHTDGSYSAFGMSDESGNTWLTAFVMKSFGSAQRYIFVDQVLVDQAKAWLARQQQANGCFASVGRLIHYDMKGGVDDEVTLSAYIAAAMLELNYTTADPVVSKALMCLRNAFTQVNSTYTQTLLFYTFTLAGDQELRNTLISVLNAKAIVSGGRRYWSRVDDGSVLDSLEVEMTSYVLLALMCGPELAGFDLGYSSSIVLWLSQQQNAFGGFASTQDTVVALQALAKYSLATYSPAGLVTVTVTSPSGMISVFAVTQSNRLLYQESQLKDVPGVYRIKAEGKGCVYTQFSLFYNIPPPPGCSSFSIATTASGNCRVPIPSLEVAITVRYTGQRLETNMVVITVKLLSGFSLVQASVPLVNSNSNSTDGTVKRVEQADGEVIIYLNGLTNGQEKVYTMTIEQDLPVQNLKPAPVNVYDYYETGERASTEYSSPCPHQ